METSIQDALFKNLLEAAPDGIVVVDSGGIVRIVNARIEKLFGYSREELIGQPIELLVPEQLRVKHIAKRSEYERNPTTRSMGIGLELAGRRKNGERFPVEISLSPVEIPSGQATIGVVRDMTERGVSLESQDLA